MILDWAMALTGVGGCGGNRCAATHWRGRLRLGHLVERGVQRAELKLEEERKAAEVEANRKVMESQAKQNRQAKAAQEAEQKPKADEAEQQRLAAVKAEQDRQAKAAADAEQTRKADEAEQQRLAAVKAEQDCQAKAAQEAETKRLSITGRSRTTWPKRSPSMKRPRINRWCRKRSASNSPSCPTTSAANPRSRAR